MINSQLLKEKLGCFEINGNPITFFSRSLARPVSVSISSCLSVSEADVDDDVDSDKLFASFMSRFVRAWQIEIAFWQYGMASSGLDPSSRHKHIRKFLNHTVKFLSYNQGYRRRNFKQILVMKRIQFSNMSAVRFNQTL